MLLFAIGLPQAVSAKKLVRKDIAIQLYSLRDKINKNLKENGDYTLVLKELSDMGYTAVEAASYADGKFYNRTPEQFKNDVETAGMSVLSSHTAKQLTAEELRTGDFSESLRWWDQCIAAHKAAGMEYIVTPWMAVPKTVKDLQTYCDYYNEVGKRCLESGIRYGYHNHAHEFVKIEDQVIMMDYIIENTDPRYVFIEMDVYWAVMGKQSPVDYFHKYPGRFKLLHIKDHREIGQSGMVGFDAIFANTDIAGVEHIIVEVEQYSYEPEKSVKTSLDYLQKAPFVKKSYKK